MREASDVLVKHMVISILKKASSCIRLVQVMSTIVNVGELSKHQASTTVKEASASTCFHITDFWFLWQSVL